MVMGMTMTEVFSPDGKESGKYRENEIPEGWLRTPPTEDEIADFIGEEQGIGEPTSETEPVSDPEKITEHFEQPDPKLTDEEEKEFQEMLDADRPADPVEKVSER